MKLGIKDNQLGVSTVIVVMLSLVLIVVVVSNVFLWSYQMNQLDWERQRENVEMVDVYYNDYQANFTIKNKGPLTAHLVSLWVINDTVHKRYDINVYINSGETLSFLMDVRLPHKPFIVKVVTERGNICVRAVGI